MYLNNDLPEILSGFEFLDDLHGVGAFGPTIAAFATVFLLNKKDGVVNLLKRAVSLNFDVKWLIPTLLIFPFIYVISSVVGEIAGGGDLDLGYLTDTLKSPWFVVTTFLQMLFLGGPLQEEFGWRGFLQDKLLYDVKKGAVISSLITGLIWGLWHIPLFLIMDSSVYEIPIAGFVMGTMAQSVIFTWLYVKSNRSILVPLLLHASLNSSAILFGNFSNELVSLVYFVTVMVVAVFAGVRLRKNS